jgi:hypothetical protein
MISEDQVRQADEALAGMTERDTRKLIRNFQKKQEPLLVYIAAVIEREGLNEGEQDLLTTATILSWRVMQDAFPKLKKLTMEEIEDADNKLFSTLEHFDGMNQDQQMQFGTKVLAEYPERELLGYLSEKVMAAEEIREDAKGLIFLILKNVLDLLIQATN